MCGGCRIFGKQAAVNDVIKFRRLHNRHVVFCVYPECSNIKLSTRHTQRKTTHVRCATAPPPRVMKTCHAPSSHLVLVERKASAKAGVQGFEFACRVLHDLREAYQFRQVRPDDCRWVEDYNKVICSVSQLLTLSLTLNLEMYMWHRI